MTTALTLRENNIDQYVAEIKRYPLLNAEEELRWRGSTEMKVILPQPISLSLVTSALS